MRNEVTNPLHDLETKNLIAQTDIKSQKSITSLPVMQLPSLTCLPDAGLPHDGDPDLGLGAPPQVGPQELEGTLTRRRHLWQVSI